MKKNFKKVLSVAAVAAIVTVGTVCSASGASMTLTRGHTTANDVGTKKATNNMSAMVAITKGPSYYNRVNFHLQDKTGVYVVESGVEFQTPSSSPYAYKSLRFREGYGIVGETYYPAATLNRSAVSDTLAITYNYVIY